MSLIILNREWTRYWFILKIYSGAPGLHRSCVCLPLGFQQVYICLADSGGQPAQSLWAWGTIDASQERNCPQGVKCQADKLEPVMKPHPSHGKDNSEHSMKLPSGFVPLGTQVWVPGKRSLQVETERAIFTKIFWGTEDSDDLKSSKPQSLSVSPWVEKAAPPLSVETDTVLLKDGLVTARWDSHLVRGRQLSSCPHLTNPHCF